MIIMVLFICIGLTFSADMGYPGRNKKKLDAIKSEWEKYYQCLQNDYNLLGETKQRQIEAHYIFPGQWVDLPCEACERPFANADNITWKYQTLPNITTSPPDFLILPPEFSLTRKNILKIRNARPEFSGLYQCFRGNNTLAAYIVEIPEDVNVTQVSLNEAVEYNVTIPNTNANISTVWGNWTKCSACGEVGKKFLFGTCKIKYSPSLNETTQLKRIFYKFKDGLSCTSLFVPQELRSLKAISNTTHYIAMNFCKDICQPKSDKIEIDPKQIDMERFSETLDNIKGKMAEEESLIVDGKFGSRILLQCPGILEENIPVTWKINEKELIPEIVQNDTNGRVTIDFFQRVSIQKAMPIDSTKYSCWQQDRRVGSIHVYVDKQDVELDRNAMIITASVILILTLTVAIRALKRRRRKAKLKQSVLAEMGTAEERNPLTEDEESFVEYSDEASREDKTLESEEPLEDYPTDSQQYTHR